jgi:hypothetical protein
MIRVWSLLGDNPNSTIWKLCRFEFDTTNQTRLEVIEIPGGREECDSKIVRRTLVRTFLFPFCPNLHEEQMKPNGKYLDGSR